MRLSIVIPSNRDSIAAYARIMQACSWASDEIEVVVRDNSGSQRKQQLFERIEHANCRVIVAEPCDANVNFHEALLAATGDFILLLADDDGGFDRGISAISSTLALCADDQSVSGVTGIYALEQTNTSQIVDYPNIGSRQAVDRLGGYLGYQGPNLIFYSAIRRSLQLETWDFISNFPINLSFHDHFFPLIHLLAGRFISVGRLTLINDNANWEAAGVGVQSDLKFYVAAGMDPAMRQLHWMICGFEGASIILQSRFGRLHPLAQRQAMANQWFEVMFRRFAGDAGARFGSALTAEANSLHEKWRREAPNFTLESLLADICGFISLTSPEKAEAYRTFWTTLAATPVS